MPFETVATLADRSGVQASAVVRFAKLFGFEGFTDMQQLFRARLMEMALHNAAQADPKTSSSSPSCHATISAFADAAMLALKTLQVEGPSAPFIRCVTQLANSPRVHILGVGRAFGLAAYLATTLRSLGCAPIHLLEGTGGTLANQTSTVGKDDALVVISLPPHDDETIQFAEAVHGQGCRTIVSIVDGRVPSLSAISTGTLQAFDGTLQGVLSTASIACILAALAAEIGTAVLNKE